MADGGDSDNNERPNSGLPRPQSVGNQWTGSSALQRAALDDQVMASPSSAGAPRSSFSLISSPFARGVREADPSSSHFISPSKEGEIPMECSPMSVKKSSSATVDTGASPVLPTTPLSSKASESQGPSVEAHSPEPQKSGTHLLFSSDDSDEGYSLKPADIFAGSPDSPDTSPVLKTINLNSFDTEDDGNDPGDFLSRQTDQSFRRCRSQEIRKNYNDLSNTPPNSFSSSGSRRSLFKRPLDVPVKEKSFSKRLKDGAKFISEVPETEAEAGDNGATATATASPCKEVSDTDHERIQSAVDSLQSGELIADGSRNYCLPVTTGKHHDLQNINHETMACVLENRYRGAYDKLTIIDCRYPYEYKGGHIKGAINIYTEKEIRDFLQREVEEFKKASRVHILVFHCEFSSQRGPCLLRHLRQNDRQLNRNYYPKLVFPEIYCLFGGYKEFFTHHPELCEPSGYIQMDDENYVAAYLHFKARAKSWTADGGK
ncbi:M-phase inducer phosphatase [Aplysia californica]|uniref:M-phase inducer phosphatase n=1 Tax=Aplysia californica TaxID=6500 RepID=A0ABM1VQ68_APLCA|nr:M-phase inducer phosphatase [Aplysia californica]XP_012935532.1 M-phase inducer phosphatase [Aplysia californica]XP_012935534.1 M-phase inducer phosphatase [Aplysia californica]XP_035824560.1 M-phase inducer phosphatase [Aplysia californica]